MLKLGRKILSFRKRIVAIVVGVTMVTLSLLFTNDMARRAAWLGTLDEARAQGRLVPGAGLLIREETEANLPARYAGDGLGDFSHVGLYVGEGALCDTDKMATPAAATWCTPARLWAAWPVPR